MPKKKIHDIDNDTPLIPEMIAEFVTKDTNLIKYLVSRARHHFSTNENFRKNCKRKNSRVYLHAFMVHWLKGHLYRKAHGLKEQIPNLS